MAVSIYRPLRLREDDKVFIKLHHDYRQSPFINFYMITVATTPLKRSLATTLLLPNVCGEQEVLPERTDLVQHGLELVVIQPFFYPLLCNGDNDGSQASVMVRRGLVNGPGYHGPRRRLTCGHGGSP